MGVTDAQPSNGNSIKEKDPLELLLDSSYPLLQKFKDLCPGTFRHGQAVSSIIESVCLALSLEVIPMKVAALYHDIGKMYNPTHFSENQPADENPHNNMDPWLSFQIISRHVSDSVNTLINDTNFPRRVIEVISQHHGTTVTKYFFNISGSKDESIYRYKGAKPSCIESAVLMIVDNVEARSRSVTDFNEEELVETTVNELINDGQLDDVYMKLGNLKLIKTVIAKELRGTLQKRIDYSKTKHEEIVSEE